MKIEIGRAYKTRDGRKAVAAKDDGTDIYPVIVEIGDAAYYHNRDGSYLNGERNNLDLVAEWSELKLEFGKFYKTRDGLVIGPLLSSLGSGWSAKEFPFCNGNVGDMTAALVSCWTEDGSFSRTGRQDPSDLVAEVPSPAPTANDHIVAVTINGKPAPASKPFVHSNREAAVTEAKRLAALNPGSEFAVYQRVTAVTAELVMREAA